MNIRYEEIKVGDKLICNVLSGGNVVPIEHIVTRIDFLDMYGIRWDTNQEVVILGSSILEHRTQ